MSRRIEVDAARCTGCRGCALTCSLNRSGEVRLAAAAIRIVSQPDEGASVPIVCVSCPERPCVAACPVGALRDSDDTPIIDADRCIGCRLCLAACPYAAIGFDPVTKKAVKCDLCGGEPLCVQVCNAAGTMPGTLALSEGPATEKTLTGALDRAQKAARWKETSHV